MFEYNLTLEENVYSYPPYLYDNQTAGLVGNFSIFDAPLPPKWALATLVIFPLWILTGNLLVLVAVARYRKLRTLSNLVIASLALTDFILALLVVPLGLYQTVRPNLCLS